MATTLLAARVSALPGGTTATVEVRPAGATRFTHRLVLEDFEVFPAETAGVLARNIAATRTIPVNAHIERA